MKGDLNHPPEGSRKISDLIYYAFWDRSKTPVIYHYCLKFSCWHSQVTLGHTIIAKDPLDMMEPIDFKQCCKLSGYIRNGEWVSA